MHRIDTPNKAIDLFGAGRHGWRDGALASGIRATEFNAAFQNMVQEELAAVVEAAGLTLDPANHTQLLAALQSVLKISWTKISAALTAVAGTALLCDTTSAAFTVTLPAAPAFNTLVHIADYAGKFAVNNLTVARNGSNIMGLAENMVISTNNVSLTLQYIDATQGWRIV